MLYNYPDLAKAGSDGLSVAVTVKVNVSVPAGRASLSGAVVIVSSPLVRPMVNIPYGYGKMARNSRIIILATAILHY